ncbi:MAG TPA: hypothetical protein VHQ93_10200 [Chitinophagaceae bacterium]|jgi:hypothetical protein|nr:hypothetical protein [Chitinophagaceae bacterium]
MKKYFLLGSLLAIILFVMPVTIWSRVSVTQNAYKGVIPRNVLITANDWMAANALPYTRIHPTYTNLGKGVWSIRWTWQVASGNIYDATLIIKNNGQLINEPIIEELNTWPY